MIPITSASSLERALEVLLVVDLDQAVEVERRGLVPEQLQVLVGERRDDQQHRVGAGERRLPELVGVDDEVLAQDRQRGGGAGRARGRRASRGSAARR